MKQTFIQTDTNDTLSSISATEMFWISVSNILIQLFMHFIPMSPIQYPVYLSHQTHLKFPPQSTFTTANTVHNPGDVFKVQTEFLLRINQRQNVKSI